MKKIYLILSMIVLVPIGLIAQNDIYYKYDANGNRYERGKIIIPPDDKSSDTTFFDEDDSFEQYALIEEIGNTNVSFFPNPVTKMLNIEISANNDPQLGDFILYNNDGKELQQGELQNQTKIDFGEYPPGFYLIQVEIDRQKESWKIIKR